jgi:hypothetical protein
VTGFASLVALLPSFGLLRGARLTSQIAGGHELLLQSLTRFFALQPLGLALLPLGDARLLLGFALGLTLGSSLSALRSALLTRRTRVDLRLFAASFSGTLLVPLDGINCQRDRSLDLDRNRSFSDAGQVGDEAIDGTS